MLFRKAETCEAEAIRALYQAVIGTPFCTWDESYPGETESQAIFRRARSTCWRKIIKRLVLSPLFRKTSWIISTAGRSKKTPASSQELLSSRISSTRDCPFIWLKALSGSFKDRELPQSILPSQKRISRRRSSIGKRASIFVGKPTCTGTVISCAKGPSKFVR